MLWGRLPLDGVGSCWLFITDDLHDNLSWAPASDKPHTFKSCFTHSSQVFFGRPGPFLPGTGLDLTLFISPLERMTCPNHLSRRSRTRMARSHIPSLACSSSIDGSSDGLTPQIQRIIARSLRHSRWRAAEVMGQVSVPCNIELHTSELNRRPLRSKGTGLDVSKGRFSRNLPQAHLHLAVAAAMQNCRTKRLCILSPFLSTTALENGIGMDTAPPSTWSLGKSHNRVSSWWQSPQSQHYGLSSFQHSYYLCGIPLLSAYGSSSFFGAHIIRLDGRIVPDRAFQHNPDRDQLRQGCWYRP